ncbi:hypothetical protein DFH09DRAFT_1330692 [Mycena vulgaris]|nr:hypothetical protein DFH09DRAFT_1330692 [Mycena vulgaris]
MLFEIAVPFAVLLSLATASPVAQNGTLERRVTGINLGHLTVNGDHVAWFSGAPKSRHTDIGPASINPCTRTFNLKTADGGSTGTYQEENCGGAVTDFWINKNGAFYAQCEPFSEPDADGVHTEWHCA